MKKSTLEKIYIMCLALALILHIFNTEGDGIKLFHIPALVACVLSYYFVPKKGVLFKLVNYFVFFIVISAAISLVSNSLAKSLTYVILLYGCYGVAYVDLEKLLNWMVFLIPIDILVLCSYAITQPEFRFKAYYTDPNFMCTTLLLFLFICLLAYMRTKHVAIKTILIVTMILICVLVLLTVSRTGIFCALLMLVFVSTAVIKKHLIKFVVGIIIGLFMVQHFAYEFVDAQWSLLYDRTFKSSDSVDNATEMRSNLSMQNVRFILDHPQYILFGLGPGGVHPDGAKQIPGLSFYRIEDLGDHNTWSSFFSEQGLLSFMCYISLLFITFRIVLKTPDKTYKLLKLGFYLSLFLFSFSISQKTYLPFWWGIFLLNNNNKRIGIVSNLKR